MFLGPCIISWCKRRGVEIFILDFAGNIGVIHKKVDGLSLKEEDNV